ncbi:hypothetical protein CEXT_299011 [Caerostris extrusa]|uniref:Uncharacterized protein n=1 Tax=Caerostris extrusa TaxID=172846 RepID=A0AAV4V2Z3_CAEEX|nr:hypothetical protein CEXT_299011 [Caerostris extrusa]
MDWLLCEGTSKGCRQRNLDKNLQENKARELRRCLGESAEKRGGHAVKAEEKPVHLDPEHYGSHVANAAVSSPLGPDVSGAMCAWKFLVKN